MPHTPAAVAAQIDDFVTRIREQTGVPGIAVAISNLEQRIFVTVGTTRTAGAEPMTRHSRFRIGGVTQLLLAAVVLELVRERDVDLELSVGEYLPELRGTPVGNSVRVAHLLSHTSGYRGVNVHDAASRALTWDRFVDYLRSVPQFFRPGKVFSYEHTEAVLLGRIIRRITGKGSNALMREILLGPLGISVAEWGRGASGQTSAGHHDIDPTTRRFLPTEAGPALSGFWESSFARFAVSIADLLVVAEALATPNDNAAGPISTTALEQLQHRVVTLPAIIGGPTAELHPVAFGYGTAHLRDGFLGHNGLSRGQCIGVRYDPGSRLCLVVGLNAQLPHLRDYVLTVLCQILSGRRTARAPQTLPFSLDELAGTYLGGGRTMVTAECSTGRLILQIGAEGDARKLRAELAVGENGEAFLECAMPDLSLAFFREEQHNDIGLMLGLGACKRMSRGTA